MFFAYLDEFGHIGPYDSRGAGRFNESPVFGLAGVLLPEPVIRPFATKFLQLKSHVLKEDIRKAGCMPQKWEKKGKDIFRPRAVARYPELRTAGFRLVNHVRDVGGRIFYYGREKIVGKHDGNTNGLYTTVMGHTIWRLNDFAGQRDHNFIIVLDENSARKELLETAAKTMYGANPARSMISPPFEVQSHLNQNIQAADWLAAIISKLWAHELQPDQYDDHGAIHRYFWDRIHQLAVHSAVDRRRPQRTMAQQPHIRHRNRGDRELKEELYRAGFNND